MGFWDYVLFSRPPPLLWLENILLLCLLWGRRVKHAAAAHKRACPVQHIPWKYFTAWSRHRSKLGEGGNFTKARICGVAMPTTVASLMWIGEVELPVLSRSYVLRKLPPFHFINVCAIVEEFSRRIFFFFLLNLF